MIWTLLAFGVTLLLLRKLAFPRIAGGARPARARRSRSRSRRPSGPSEEADELLAEYRARLKEAREQADDIIARARKAAEHARGRVEGRGRKEREELLEATRRDIEAETHRALDEIRKEVADLTVLATEKVTRKSLDSDDHQRLIDEALAEVDFSALAGGGERELGRWRRSPRSTRARCSRPPRSTTTSTACTTSSASSPTRSTRTATCRSSSSRRTSPRRRRRTGSRKLDRGRRRATSSTSSSCSQSATGCRSCSASGARSTRSGREENKLLPVTVTSAVELDEGMVAEHRQADREADRPAGRAREQGGPRRARRPRAAGRQHGPRRERPQPTRTDFASRSRGPALRRRPPNMQIKPDEITSILKSRIEGLEDGGADLSEVGTVLSVADGIARVHGLDNCMSLEMLELPHDVTGLALNLEADNVGAVLFGDWDKIEEGDTVKRTGQACSRSRSARRCSAASSTRSATRSTARATSTPPRPARPSSRRPASSSASRSTEPHADRHQGDRRDDPDRPRPARADHRRPPDRQDRDRDRHDHQQQGQGPDLDLRRDRPAHVDRRRRSRRRSRARRAGEHDHRRRARRRGRADQVHGARTPAARWASTSSTTGKHALCIYDDLTKHAYAYRQMSLLLRRPPGREAYPGDVFYLHSRLLERAVKLNDDLGGGSLTALPIIETQAGDVSAYIPTNVISITDGQIFLEARPVPLGRAPGDQRRHLGVARRRQRPDEADEEGRRQAAARALAVPRARGVRAVRLRARRRHPGARSPAASGSSRRSTRTSCKPWKVEDQVAAIYSGTGGYLDRIKTERIREFHESLLQRLHSEHDGPDGARSPTATGTTTIEEALGNAIAEAIDDFGPDFDDEGNPLEEGESDRISPRRSARRRRRTERGRRRRVRRDARTPRSARRQESRPPP